jgi:hypothetical protein
MTVPRRFAGRARHRTRRAAAVLGAGALCVAAALVPGSGAQAAPSRDACFARSNINGFSAPNDRTVYVRVGVSQIFRLDLMTKCINLTFRQNIGLEARPANAFICSPLEATVVYRDTGGGFPQRCPVTAIHKLTPEEIAALPKKDRP